MPERVTPGQAAYDKWLSLVNVPVSELPTWGKLQPGERSAWEDVALAAINQHIDDKE